MKTRMPFLRILACVIGAGSLQPSSGRASALSLHYSYEVANGDLRLSVPAHPALYYTLETSSNLHIFTPIGMSLGYVGTVWEYSTPLEPAQGFFRVKAVNIFAPQDTDGDGIDDRYELEHAIILNPLDASDAAADPDHNGYSNYQEYLRDLFGGPDLALQFFSREVSVWNFDVPTAQLEAFSPEVSVYNGNPGSGPPATDISQSFSRETTVWNYGSPSARIEAISATVSVYSAHPGSGPPATDIAQVFSREVAVFNFGAPSARLEAISREVSAFNLGEPSANVEAISREVSVLNFQDPADP